ncbi:hypothetical protein T01_7033 [Trichinella spiralis]|uniref:Uncharacterized protein n=1 Tax=Trichinella spiralis TaxID=6334 RepID=A0A0V1BTA8_TRISP|nr:hypothetical protein T01_7033 [Trichinella spiralis]
MLILLVQPVSDHAHYAVPVPSVVPLAPNNLLRTFKNYSILAVLPWMLKRKNHAYNMKLRFPLVF